MSLSYDPIQPGKETLVNSPYQYWKSYAPSAIGGYVELFINNKKFTATVQADGYWELQLPLRLDEGGHNLSIRYFDRAGNVGDAIQTRLLIDLSPPDKPAITRVVDDVGPVQGPVANKGFTDDGKPTISGYAEPDSIVRVYSNGVLLGSVQAGKNGQWTLEPELVNGEHRLYVTATDRFGQVSEDSDVFTVFVNVPRIEKPQLLEVYDNEGVNTGLLKQGEETNDLTPRLSGNAPAGAESIHIYINGVRVGIALVEDGKWSWESTKPVLSLGENVITLRSQNVRGEYSDESEPFNVIAVPTPPVVIEYALDNFGSAQGKLEHGALTDDFTPTLKGTAEANSIVYIYATRENGSWWLKGSTKADASGNWEVEIARLDGGAGPYHFQASNSPTRDPSAPMFDLYVSDNGTKLKPVIEFAEDNVGAVQGRLENGAITDDATPTFSGTAEANRLVYIHVRQANGDWVLQGSVVADTHGKWQLELPALTGGNGQYAFQASNTVTRDPAAKTFELTLATGDALKPVIDYAYDDVGSAQGRLESGAMTDDVRPKLYGHAEANSTLYIEFYKENEPVRRSVAIKVGADGKWEWQADNYLYASWYDWKFRTVDESGQVKSDEFTLRIRKEGMEFEPTIEYAEDNVGASQGKLVSGAITDDSTPTFKGSAEANSLVYIHVRQANGTWKLQGSVMTDASGKWQLEIPALTGGNGQYEFQASKTTAHDSSAKTFVLNLATGEALKPVIDYAYDDVGSAQGRLESGAMTDDVRPKLYGHAEANSTLYIEFYKENEPVRRSVAIKVGADGKWEWQADNYLYASWYDWKFRTVDESGQVKSDEFTLRIRKEGMEFEPTIEYAEDNVGASQGKLVSGAMTDDFTPTLKGKAEANSIIHLFNKHINGDWSYAGSAKADAQGNWQLDVTIPEKWNGQHQFTVSNTPVRDKNAPAFTLEFNADAIKVDEKGYKWDFEDGTLQGWTAAGEYKRNNELVVKPWSSSKGSNELGSATGDPTKSGYNGDVVYRYIEVEAGKSYRFDFDGTRLSNPDGKFPPKMGMTVDGKPIIAPSDLVYGWNHYTGVYTATETKTVRVAITNETSTGWGNDFALDNIEVKQVRASGKGDFYKGPNGETGAFTFKTGTEYAFASGLKIKLQKEPDIGGKQKTLENGDLILGRGGEMKLDFGGVAEKVIFKSSYVHSKGNFVDFYDTQGKLLYSYELKAHPKQHGIDNVEYTAPNGKLIGSVVIRPSATEVDALGNPGGVRLSDLEWGAKDISFSSGTKLQSLNSILEMGDESHIALADLLTETKRAGTVSMEGHGKNIIDITVDDILHAGGKDLFQADGKTQLRVMGDAGDVVKLDDVLGDGVDNGDWQQQSGTLTIGGIQYQVFNHSGADVELLVQNGVKTELI